MNEREFLSKLQERAREQEKLINDMVFPRVFTIVGIWFGNHPWRILIPLAFIFSLAFHGLIGKPYDDLILRIFGGPK
ncbi:hypothetical protein KJ980_05560 [Patescibacteria group bacterium]|nr:hypothetical protein [Patescibacteria group bacterium]MBU4016478.1 hypothetical protein [Patescibacteria group bacterium]MBU4099088.1 hypothetical protein [Patescibacteria group bacterium]